MMAERTLHLVGNPPIEFIDAGRGPPVVLLHSSASGAHQWEALTAELAPTRRVIAPNLLGYGRTDPRDGASRASAAAQAMAMIPALEGLDGPIDLVGHSFGAVIALELALALGPRAGRLALFEPNAFAMLDGSGFEAERLVVARLHARIRLLAARAAWTPLAALFADFFSGPGTWAAMPAVRRDSLAAALRHNADEWSAVMAPALEPQRWQTVGGPVLLAWARDSPAPLRAVASALMAVHPGWMPVQLDRGGHLAPLVRPRPFNRVVCEFLAGGPDGTPGIVAVTGR